MSAGTRRAGPERRHFWLSVFLAGAAIYFYKTIIVDGAAVIGLITVKYVWLPILSWFAVRPYGSFLTEINSLVTDVDWHSTNDLLVNILWGSIKTVVMAAVWVVIVAIIFLVAVIFLVGIGIVKLGQVVISLSEDLIKVSRLGGVLIFGVAALISGSLLHKFVFPYLVRITRSIVAATLGEMFYLKSQKRFPGDSSVNLRQPLYLTGAVALLSIAILRLILTPVAMGLPRWRESLTSSVEYQAQVIMAVDKEEKQRLSLGEIRIETLNFPKGMIRELHKWPDHKSQILIYIQGPVTVSSVAVYEGHWYQVSYKGKTGWVDMGEKQ